MLTTPLMLRSSKPLNWPGIEVQSYLEPTLAEQWAESISPDIMIILLTQGITQLEECDRGTCGGFRLQQGDMLLKPAAAAVPNIRSQTQSSDPVKTLRLTLSYGLFSQTVEELIDRDPARIRLTPLVGIQDQLVFYIGSELARELETPSAFSLLYVQTAAHMLMVHLLRTYTIDQLIIRERYGSLSRRQLKQITDYIQEHLTNPLSLDELAQQIGFSSYHFARLFRETTGESAHQFVIRQRVEFAKQLLRNNDLTLTEVAIASGFADQSHLTQRFKRCTGLTPKAYRKTI